MEPNPYPHPIRLRGPWEASILGGSSGNDGNTDGDQATAGHNSQRVNVPGDWSPLFESPQQAAEFRGTVRYRRSFGQPATLASHERAWLVIEGVDARGTAALNGVPLGIIASYAQHAEFDVTRLLERRNALILDVKVPDNLEQPNAIRPGREQLPGGALGEVRLEVRSKLWLEDVSVQLMFPPGGVPIVRASARLAGDTTTEEIRVELFVSERETASDVAPPQRHREQVTLQPGQCFSVSRPIDLKRMTTADFQSSLKNLAGLPQCDFDVLLRVVTDQVHWRKWFRVGRRWTEEVGIEPSQPRHEPAVLRDSEYDKLDDSGTSIIQHLPPAWIEAVWPRLVRHPSIVAFASSAEAISSLGADYRVPGMRPWIVIP